MTAPQTATHGIDIIRLLTQLVGITFILVRRQIMVILPVMVNMGLSLVIVHVDDIASPWEPPS